MIHELLGKINSRAKKNAQDDFSQEEHEEIVSFDKNGEIVPRPFLRQFSVALIVVLTGTLSFGLGRLTVVRDTPPVRIEYDPSIISNMSSTSGKKSEKLNNTNTASVIQGISKDEQVTASIKGTKYHFSHCSGAKQISEANKIVFESATLAEAAGYTLAANCKAK